MLRRNLGKLGKFGKTPTYRPCGSGGSEHLELPVMVNLMSSKGPPSHIKGGKNGIISYRKLAQISQVKVEIIFCEGNIFHFGRRFQINIAPCKILPDIRQV